MANQAACDEEFSVQFSCLRFRLLGRGTEDLLLISFMTPKTATEKSTTSPDLARCAARHDTRHDLGSPQMDSAIDIPVSEVGPLDPAVTALLNEPSAHSVLSQVSRINLTLISSALGQQWREPLHENPEPVWW